MRLWVRAWEGEQPLKLTEHILEDEWPWPWRGHKPVDKTTGNNESQELNSEGLTAEALEVIES